MKITDAVKVLKESRGESVYNIFIPSWNKEYGFKPLTVGQQKSISKIAIDDSEFDVHYMVSQLAVIQNCCLEDIDTTNFTDIDFISVLADIRRNNITTPLVLQMYCKDCGTDKKLYEFQHEIDFNKIVSNCREYEFKTVEFEKTYKKVKYKFVLKDANILDYIGYRNYLDTVVNDDELVNLIDVDKSKILNYPIQFIHNIYINDEEVEDWPLCNYIKKLRFVDNFVDNEVMYNENESVLKVVTDTFNDKRLQVIFPDIECPKCHAKKGGAIAFDNFFII